MLTRLRRDGRGSRGRRGRTEKGQVLLIFMGLFSLSLALGAFAIDQGIFLSKRRETQKDADAAALGAAQVYFSSLSAQSQAEVQASKIATQNGVDVPGTDSAFAGSTNCTDFRGVTVNGAPSIHAAINRPTKSLFGSLFGLDGLQDLGAQATACFVRTTELGEGIDPFFISPSGPCFANSEPRLGRQCTFKFGAQGGNPPADRGTLSLDDDSSGCTQKSGSDLSRQIAEGAPASCKRGDLVYTKTGNAQSVIDALRCRLAGKNGNAQPCNGVSNQLTPQSTPGEGACNDSFHDANGKIPPFTGLLTASPVDDLTEAFSLPGGGGAPNQTQVETGSAFLVTNICADTWRGDGITRPDHKSPRILTIIISNGLPVNGPGGSQITIDRFATFYVLGCAKEADVLPDGSVPADKIATDCGSGNSGHNTLVGIFIKAYIPNGGCGAVCLPPDDSGGSIVLVK